MLLVLRTGLNGHGAQHERRCSQSHCEFSHRDFSGVWKDCETLREIRDNNNTAIIRHAGRLCSGPVADLHCRRGMAHPKAAAANATCFSGWRGLD